MLFQTSIIALLASVSFVVALPGGSSYASPAKPTHPPKDEVTCSAGKIDSPQTQLLERSLTIWEVYHTKTNVGEKETTYLTTKTVVIPITTVSGKPTTNVSPCPYTSTGYETKASPHI
jgi:hypothetical protein